MSVIVSIPSADDKWLKLVSLQIDTSQFLIIGKVSLIDKLSKLINLSLKYEFINSLKIFCSSKLFPVAKKNLQSFILRISSITFKKVCAGILLVGPEPPIANNMLVCFLFISKVTAALLTKFSSI